MTWNPALTVAVNGDGFEARIAALEAGAGGGGSSAPAFTLVSSGIANKAAANTVAGTASVANVDEPAFSLKSGAITMKIDPETGVMSATGVPVDIMYSRSASVTPQAIGKLHGSTADISLSDSLTIPVVEAGPATLTLTRTNAGTPLSCVEFNDTLKSLGSTVQVSGSAGPWTFNVITELSEWTAGDGRECPIEVEAHTGAILMTGLCDRLKKATETARIRAEDRVTGAYGYLDISVAIGLFDPAVHIVDPVTGAPDLMIFDPVNTTGPDSGVTGFNVTYQGVTHTLKPYATYAGAAVITRVFETGPDGVSRPSLVFPNFPFATFICSPSKVGTSATLANVFASHDGPFARWTAMSTSRVASAAPLLITLGIDTGGPSGLGAAFTTMRHLGVNATYAPASYVGDFTDRSALSAPERAAIGASLGGFGPAATAATLNTFMYRSDGYTGAAYVNGVTGAPGGGGSFNIEPGVDDRTNLPTALRLGPYVLSGGAGTLYWNAMLPREAETWELEAIQLWLCRRYTHAAQFVPPKRKIVSGHRPWFYEDWKRPLVNMANDRWEPLNNDTSKRYDGINDENAAQISYKVPGTRAIFPDDNIVQDTTVGKLTVSMLALTDAQKADLQAYSWNAPQPKTSYEMRGGGLKSNGFHHEYGCGYTESEGQGPDVPGLGAWYDWSWWYSVTGKMSEEDLGETFAGMVTYTTSTIHPTTGGNIDGGTYLAPFMHQRMVRHGWDMIDNLDGTVTHNRYFNRRLVRSYTGPMSAHADTRALRIDITSNTAQSAYSPDSHDMQVGRIWTYRDKRAESYQPPLAIPGKPATVARTGNTFTGATDAGWISFSPNGLADLAKTYRWWKANDGAETALAAAGVMAVTYAPAAGDLLFFETRATNAYGTIKQRTFYDPGA